jgi:hypothetical protein
MTMMQTILREAATQAVSGNRHYKDPSGKGTVPHCIYYYHITPSADPPTRVYFLDKRRPISTFELGGLIAELARNAHSDGDSPSPCGWDMTDLIWRRKSYLVVVLDDPATSLVKGDGFQFPDANNHTFLDGADFDVDVSSTPGVVEMRSGLWCINHMMNEAGQDLGGTDFEIFRVHFNTGGGSMFAMSYPDDSGTNMGPPLPPP